MARHSTLTVQNQFDKCIYNIFIFASVCIGSLVRFGSKTKGSDIIHFLKVMYLNLTLQVPLTLPSVFSKTDAVFLKEDTQKCVFNDTCPRACISHYNPLGVYWLIQALVHVLCIIQFF